MKVSSAGLLAVFAFAAAGAGQTASAAPNLVLNGDFTTETVGGSASTTSAQLSSSASSGPTSGYGGGATVTNWTNTSYAFVFTPGAGTSGTTADTTGATINQYGGYNGSPNVYLYGPGAGGGSVNNGLTVSPTGGNFIAVDGAYGGAISQTINNLVVGASYNLSFNWAAAQQEGFTGATTEGWNVTFGSSSFSTAVLNDPATGFQPWRQATITFVAAQTSQLLSFLAVGTPNGSPPMSLLDSVSLSVPEPSALQAIAASLLIAAGVMVYRRKSKPDRGAVA